MTGTDLQLCDLERVKPQPPPSLLLGLEPVQSCLGIERVMSEQKVTNYSVPVIFEPPCTIWCMYSNCLLKMNSYSIRNM